MSTLKLIRQYLRPVKRGFRKLKGSLIEHAYRLRAPVTGSSDWLIKKEIIYGGLVEGVPRKKVSQLDPRPESQLASGGMIGGDRMFHHRYAPIYSHYLSFFTTSGGGITLAEFGILKGSGLAIWCDLFPQARVIGFDIDPDHFEANKVNLIRRGAFISNQPCIYEYDQFLDGSDLIATVLEGRTLDIVIDDGFHSRETILATWRSVKLHLSSRFVYLIEDYAGLLDECPTEFQGYDAYSSGLMTVISAGVPVFGSRT